MVEVLRLGHRIARDKRISTHVCLVSRAFGASKLYYSGQKDSDMEDSVFKIVKDFGGDFKVEYVTNYSRLIKDKKKNGFKIIHLTVYGEKLDVISQINGKNILFIVGGEKVPGEVYELVDYNISIGNQPHSEVAALSITLYEHFGKDILSKKFKDSKLEIVPQKKGKKILGK
jgi:tRNA (cytidine56-2'-O)-methyltransferase